MPNNELKYDATFEAFKLLTQFLEAFTIAQEGIAELKTLHMFADKLADVLTKPECVYTARYDENGNYIDPADRVTRV